MSDCGYNCTGCPRCDAGSFGLVPSRGDPVWGADFYGGGYGLPDGGAYGGVEEDVSTVLDAIEGGFDTARGALESTGGRTAPGGGQPRHQPSGPLLQPESDPRPPSARTPISAGDAAMMATGGLLLGRALAGFFR